MCRRLTSAELGEPLLKVEKQGVHQDSGRSRACSTPRAGGFEPLRFLPKGKVIVLGLVSTKVTEMETVDGLKRRIDEAAKYAPLDQIAISLQCGFFPDVVGNLISDDDQKRKLEVVVETARKVWR